MKNNINWERIENEVWSPFFAVHFMLDGHKIDVQKSYISDSKQIFVVYIDGSIKGSWNKENFPIISKVWCKRTKSLYSKKFKDGIIKTIGKRRAKKEFDLDGKIEHLWSNFSTSKRWISQFKKLEGLEQVDL